VSKSSAEFFTARRLFKGASGTRSLRGPELNYSV